MVVARTNSPSCGAAISSSTSPNTPLIRHRDLLLFGDALRQAREQIVAAMGVSAPQYAILMAMARFGANGPTVSEVAGILRVSVPFIVAQDRGLVAAGLLRKQPDREDARWVRLVLPPTCRAALKRLAPLQCRINDTLFAGLDAVEFSALHRALRKLARPQKDAA